MLSLDVNTLAQDTSGVLRISNGNPVDLKRVEPTHIKPTLHNTALKMARRYGYTTNKNWEDTIRYWTDQMILRAVSFISSSYEYTTVIFSERGKWLQTTNYLNPEYRESDKVISVLSEKGYNLPSSSSPIGSIIKYRTNRDAWYEADVYENGHPQTILTAVLDKQFRFVGIRK
jgi:hypothetical protein